LFTSLHSEFIGTCDYIWYSPSCCKPHYDTGDTSTASSVPNDLQPSTAASTSAEQHLRPVAVLAPPLIELLPYGLPALLWGSDHVSLISEFELF
jgi:hypothetical protein